VSPEAYLWAAVLLQALADSQGRRGGSMACPEAAVLGARAWLRGGSHSLHLALAATGLDWGWWASRALPVLSTRWAAIDGGQATRPRICHSGPRRGRQDAIRPWRLTAGPPAPESAILAACRRPGTRERKGVGSRPRKGGGSDAKPAWRDHAGAPARANPS
jgi:hypothetical protein